MSQQKRNSDKDLLEFEGIVVQNYSNGFFQVQLVENNALILAYISGKIRINFIRIVVGDHVRVQMTPYDLSRGRIIYRYPRKKIFK